MRESKAAFFEAGKAATIAGKSSDASALLERALEIAEAEGDAEQASDVLDWLAWLAWIELDGEGTRACAERMLDLHIPSTSASAFRLFVRQATLTLQTGDALKALRIVEDAELASKDADVDSFAAYLSLKGDIYSALGDPDAGLTHARLATEIASRRSNPYLLWRCTVYLGYALHAAGRLSDSLDAYDDAERIARGAGLTWEVGMSCARSAWVAFLMGRIDEARTSCLRAFDVRGTQKWMVVNRAWVALFVGLASGDDGLIRIAADEAHVASALRSQDSYTIGPTLAAFSQYFHQIGRLDRAAELLTTALDLVRSPDCAWTLFPLVARRGGARDVERAELLLAKFPPTHTVARAHRLLFNANVAERSGDRVGAERAAGEAQVVFEDDGCAYYAAHCRKLAGRLTEAHHSFVAMGALRDAEQLRSARVPRGRPRKTYERSRQRNEVRALVLQGLSNRAIAERLGVSIRTIKSRVSAVYDAEGVTSRPELLARRSGRSE